ncbi:hypothetical protein DICVIV_13412 [Dictyocaulus viviparus]|uniref:Uncharacterized protein n=1 Tax=Dictyocaulus viviparus TaxID=29172 RepID=A0A0D8XAF3_DICVI|nr:hypothetical protein DICVIV_13412 [Dictyocaulus viviparus]
MNRALSILDENLHREHKYIRHRLEVAETQWTTCGSGSMIALKKSLLN